MANNYIDKFKKNGIEYEIHAESAEYANLAVTAQVCETCDSIGNVKKYSTTPSGDDDKYREGLRIENTHGKDGLVQGIIELNNKGNLAIESLDNHVNLEAKKQIKMKPTTKMIWDSSRKVEAGKGNEFEIEAVNDDLDTNNQEKWSELKIKSRNIDLRCNNHGGIALQIAGKDGDDNENKIKFESDRTSSISEPGTYNGEGGKGLEFGTFNNLHSSLYTGDYRFRGNGFVYGVLRDAPVAQGDKIDYITQDDDFKDPINNTTPKATWNQIIEAANKCVGKEEVASVQQVEGLIAEASIPGYTGTTGHLATQEYVQDYVAQHGGGAGSYQAGTGIYIEDNTISVNNYSNIEPLTALTDNADALEYVKIGKSKGNFAVDVTGKYTWEATNPKETTTVDEYDNVVAKGDRVVKYTNEDFYTDSNKFYYKASIDTKLPDNTSVLEGTIVYNSACTLNTEGVTGYTILALGEGEQSFYEDENKYVYKGTKNISIEYGQTKPITKKKILDPSQLSAEELAYYDSQTAVYDEEGNLISGWEKVPVWAKNTLWTKNEINVNLETDSKIKFAGKKIETVWTVNDVDRKMEEILLSTENLAVDATEVTFEKKISKNGDRSGQDTELVYIYENNVSDPEKTPDEATFIANYMSKHPGATQEEAEAKYAEFMAEGTSFEIRVKVSELLGFVARVGQLERTIADLTSRIEALESERDIQINKTN